MFRLLSRFFVVVLLCCVAGCGASDRTVQLKGQVFTRGKTITLTEGETMMVIANFKDSSGAEKSASAEVQKDGSFLIGDTPGNAPIAGAEIQICFEYASDREIHAERRFGRNFSAGFQLVHQLSEESDQAIDVDLVTENITKK